MNDHGPESRIKISVILMNEEEDAHISRTQAELDSTSEDFNYSVLGT